MIHGEISRVLALHPALATTRCVSTERAELRLDNAFVLIEGHPRGRVGKAKRRVRHPLILLSTMVREWCTLWASYEEGFVYATCEAH